MNKHTYYLYVLSKHSRLSEPVQMWSTEQWEEWVRRKYTCDGTTSNGFTCTFRPRAYHEKPMPLQPIVHGDHRGFFCSFDTPLALTFRDDALDFFRQYLPAGCEYSPVRRISRGRIVPSRYSVCEVPHSEEVDPYRGTTPIAPQYCSTCNLAHTWTSESHELGILRWQIRDRPVLACRSNVLAVHPDFYRDMKLKERFPDIKIACKIKIYDKDPNGWVLPGDPDWDGVFRTPPGWRPPPPPESYEEFSRKFDAEQARKRKKKRKDDPPHFYE